MGACTGSMRARPEVSRDESHAHAQYLNGKRNSKSPSSSTFILQGNNYMSEYVHIKTFI